MYYKNGRWKSTDYVNYSYLCDFWDIIEELDSTRKHELMTKNRLKSAETMRNLKLDAKKYPEDMIEDEKDNTKEVKKCKRFYPGFSADVRARAKQEREIIETNMCEIECRLLRCETYVNIAKEFGVNLPILRKVLQEKNLSKKGWV